MELSSLKAEELTDNAGIALRFRDCEFDNYLEVNPDAARNLAACRRYAENWPDMLENGTSLVMTGSCGTGKIIWRYQWQNTSSVTIWPVWRSPT